MLALSLRPRCLPLAIAVSLLLACCPPPAARNSSTRICSLVVPWLCACLCVCVRVKFIFICHILLRFLLPFSPFIVAFLLLFPFVVNFSGLSDELLPFVPAAAEFIQTSLNTINLRIIIILSPCSPLSPPSCYELSSCRRHLLPTFVRSACASFAFIAFATPEPHCPSTLRL